MLIEFISSGIGHLSVDVMDGKRRLRLYLDLDVLNRKGVWWVLYHSLGWYYRANKERLRA